MEDLGQSDPQQLARVLGLASSSPGFWRPEELAAIWKHQFSDPLKLVLIPDEDDFEFIRELLQEADLSGLSTFREIVLSPNCPLRVLQITKEYSKRARQNASATAPPEISTVLYFLSIASALRHCSKRITTLDDQALVQGFTWCLEQAWLEEPEKSIFNAAREQVTKGTQP